MMNSGQLSRARLIFPLIISSLYLLTRGRFPQSIFRTDGFRNLRTGIIHVGELGLGQVDVASSRLLFNLFSGLSDVIYPLRQGEMFFKAGMTKVFRSGLHYIATI